MSLLLLWVSTDLKVWLFKTYWWYWVRSMQHSALDPSIHVSIPSQHLYLGHEISRIWMENTVLVQLCSKLTSPDEVLAVHFGTQASLQRIGSCRRTQQFQGASHMQLWWGMVKLILYWWHFYKQASAWPVTGLLYIPGLLFKIDTRVLELEIILIQKTGQVTCIWGDFYYSERTQFLRLTETLGNRKEVGKPLEQKQKEIVEPTETFKFTYWPLGIFSVCVDSFANP